MPDGNYSLTFKLYDVETGGAELWSETQSVEVKKGIFNVILGSVNPLTLPFDKQYWLGLAVEGGSELTPRIQLTSSAYSLNTRSDGGGGGNTLDQAYDQGGPGAGRTINADAGAVNIAGPDGLTVEGNVGIGTTEPYGLLTVQGPLYLRYGTQTGNTGWRLEELSDGDFQIFENGVASFLYLETGGNVGIGTTSPGAKLDVAGTILAKDRFSIYNTSLPGYNGDYIHIDRPSESYARIMVGDNNAAENLAIQPNGGNVGIGTTNPMASLHIDGKAYQSGIIVRDVVAGGHAIDLGIGDSGTIQFTGVPQDFQIESTGSQLQFQVSDAAQVVMNSNGNVGIGTASPTAKLHLQDGSVLFAGTTGVTPASGAGARMMWIPEKRAFRAGEVEGTEWDADNIGRLSFAAGFGTKASGQGSIVMGLMTEASGKSSIAMGQSTKANGDYSTAIGYGTEASAGSTAIGQQATAASGGVAIGTGANASGTASTAMGVNTNASGDYSTAMGNSTEASGKSSTAMGEATKASGSFSTAMGRFTKASGYVSTAMGENTEASGDYSIVIGEGLGVNPLVNNVPESLMVEFKSDIPTLFVGPSSGLGTTGNVGIGTTNPQSTLAVNGTITAKEVIVTLEGWPDFVLEKCYTLMPLREVEQYVKQNKRLPDIPSEKEVLEKGVSLGEMQAKLLQKVEELTLYMIEQNKKIEKLEKENGELKNRVSSLEEKIK